MALPTDRNIAKKAGFNVGVQGACMRNGISAADAIRMSSMADHALAHRPMQEALCKVAKFILAEAGETNSAAYHLYDTIEKRADALHPDNVERFLTPVCHALCEGDRFIKQAGLGELIGKGGGLAIGAVPAFFSTAATLAALGGGTAGALHWILSRDAADMDGETKAKLEQAKIYRRIAADMQKRLDLEKGEAIKKKKKIRDIIEEESEGGYAI